MLTKNDIEILIKCMDKAIKKFSKNVVNKKKINEFQQIIYKLDKLKNEM